jgi:hypothetical protein
VFAISVDGAGADHVGAVIVPSPTAGGTIGLAGAALLPVVSKLGTPGWTVHSLLAVSSSAGPSLIRWNRNAPTTVRIVIVTSGRIDFMVRPP